MEAFLPVEIKYCPYHEYFESLLDLGFIPSALSYEDIKDYDLRKYLEDQSDSSKTSINFE